MNKINLFIWTESSHQHIPTFKWGPQYVHAFKIQSETFYLCSEAQLCERPWLVFVKLSHSHVLKVNLKNLNLQDKMEAVEDMSSEVYILKIFKFILCFIALLKIDICDEALNMVARHLFDKVDFNIVLWGLDGITLFSWHIHLSFKVSVNRPNKFGQPLSKPQFHKYKWSLIYI